MDYNINDTGGNLIRKTVLVDTAVDNDLSDAAELGVYALCAVITPAALTSTALTFTGSYDGVNFFPIKDSTNVAIGVTVATGAAGYYKLAPADFVGVPFIKIVTGSAEAANRTFQLIGCRATNQL